MDNMAANYLEPEQVRLLADQRAGDLSQLLQMVQLAFRLDVAEICLECAHFRPLCDDRPCACLRRPAGYGRKRCDVRIHLPARASELVTECRWRLAEIRAKERRRREHAGNGPA